MTVLAYYLLKVCLCSGLLFLYYHLALRNKAFHQWNRFYLLGSVILSLVLPFVQVTIWQRPHDPADILRILQAVQRADDYLEAITIYSSRPKLISMEQWITVGYVLVCTTLLCGLALSLLKVRNIARQYGVQNFENIRFVNTAEPGTPFSFLRYIFWNREISLQSEAGRHIFRHELVHVEEKHTLDKLFLQSLLVLFWCNPFFWLIRRELRYIHEFIADNKAVGQHGVAAFAGMVLSAAYPQHYHTLTNPFFQTSIKRRLAMLKKINSPKVNYANRLLVLPAVAITVMAFTLRTKQETLNAFPPPVPALTDTLPKKAKQIESVEVHGPKKQVSIYYTDGSCETLTEREANRRGLVHTDGLEYGKDSGRYNVKGRAEFRIKDTGAKPILVVNGKEIDYSLLSALNPQKIKTVNVLKGESAMAIYGEKGKNGVIAITILDEESGTTEFLHEGKKAAEMNLSKVGMNENGEVLVEADSMIVFNERPDPDFNEVEIVAAMKSQEWRKHLEKQLTPVTKKAAGLGMSPGNYTVNVRFLVEKDGTIAAVQALNNPGYGLAEGAVNAVKTFHIGPKWTPGEVNRRKVRSYHTQPIYFVISDSGLKANE